MRGAQGLGWSFDSSASPLISTRDEYPVTVGEEAADRSARWGGTSVLKVRVKYKRSVRCPLPPLICGCPARARFPTGAEPPGWALDVSPHPPQSGPSLGHCRPRQPGRPPPLPGFRHLGCRMSVLWVPRTPSVSLQPAGAYRLRSHRAPDLRGDALISLASLQRAPSRGQNPGTGMML